MNRSQKSALMKTVDETIDEARNVATDIQFIMESSGEKLNGPLGYDDISIKCVEDFYRARTKSSSSIELGVENFERLLSMLLGQALVERDLGQWVAYDGKHHTVFPAVVRLSSNKHVDVFLFCKNLHQKQVSGSENGQALIAFVNNADRMAFP